MPRHDPARLSAASYPFSAPVETRFQDLDPLGHINNVAMAALFEQGRVRFNRGTLREHAGGRVPGVRWLVARVDINYLAEGFFPEPVLIASGIERIGNASWSMVSAAFQQDRCIALCDATLVYTTKDGPTRIADGLRAALTEQLFRH
jgi:acyl-CoA thioester hydrolase